MSANTIIAAKKQPEKRGGADRRQSAYSEKPDRLTSITYQERTLNMYLLAEDEVRSIASGFNSVHLAFFGIVIGATISALYGYLSVSGSIKQTFGLITTAGVIGSLYFGLMVIRDWRRTRKQLDNLLRKPPVITK